MNVDTSARIQVPKGARDRLREDPNQIFGEHILEPIFEFNCRHNFQPLLQAHRAWLAMLAERKVVSRDDARKIFQALDAVEKQGPDAMRPFDSGVEYFYLHMERALVERVEGGEAVVGNLNIGRTRPEPLARLVMRDALLRVLDTVTDIRAALIHKAGAEVATVMPGYTHLQHAQPTTLGHYLMAIHDHLQRDSRRLFAALDTTLQCTLGCGAMSGTSADVDRERVMRLLGFPALCENTIDSVSASDHVTESASALVNAMTVAGRLAQDLYIWSSQEFAMIDVGDSFSSPSSLMPQKKNALVLEYIRSRTARAVGELASCFTVQHNVGYMDTEEVEIEVYRPLFNIIELAEEALPTVAEVIRRMTANRELMRERTAWGFSSVTLLAEEIQKEKKLSYRTAHRIVARTVLLASERGRDATGIDSALIDEAADEMIGRRIAMSEASVSACLAPDRFLAKHAVVGGAAPAAVRRMIEDRKTALAADVERVGAHRRRIDDAGRELRESVTALGKP